MFPFVEWLFLVLLFGVPIVQDDTRVTSKANCGEASGGQRGRAKRFKYLRVKEKGL